MTDNTIQDSDAFQAACLGAAHALDLLHRRFDPARHLARLRTNLVFDPPWDSSKMSDEAKLALNMF